VYVVLVKRKTKENNNMGKRGPRPTPTELLVASGSWRGKARVAAGEPIAPSIAPAPPASVLSSPEMMEIWRAVCGRISAIQTLSHVDVSAIERYCHIAVRYSRASEHVLAHGASYPVVDRNGALKNYASFPQVSEANSCAAQMLKIESEFGLTPASRVGMSSSQTPSQMDDEDVDLLD